MTDRSIPLFVVTRRLGHDRDYLFVHPDTGALCTGEALDNPYCYPPAALTQDAATHELAQRNTPEEAVPWVLEVAPQACPGCGRALWANDGDFCYPKDRDRTAWRAGCNPHDFGCGFEVEGTSFETAMQAWNTATVFDYPNANYRRVEGLGFAALDTALRQVYADYPEYQGADDTTAFGAMVDKFASDPFYQLHFVARQYRHLEALHRTAY